MSYQRQLPPHDSEELRATAWRLIAVLALALSVAVAARLTLGPALF